DRSAGREKPGGQTTRPVTPGAGKMNLPPSVRARLVSSTRRVPGQPPGHEPPRSGPLEVVDLHACRGDGQRAGRGVERRLPGTDLLRLPERVLRVRAGAGELPAAPRRLGPEALQREREAVW